VGSKSVEKLPKLEAGYLRTILEELKFHQSLDVRRRKK
jgi:hypothetical protein